jgi:hypothetical protein
LYSVVKNDPKKFIDQVMKHPKAFVALNAFAIGRMDVDAYIDRTSRK